MFTVTWYDGESKESNLLQKAIEKPQVKRTDMNLSIHFIHGKELLFSLFVKNNRFPAWQKALKLRYWLHFGLTLSGPGGGSEARMAKLTAANQKPLIL